MRRGDNIGVLGAYGGVGAATARAIRVQTERPLLLAGRNADKLTGVAQTLGGPVATRTVDSNDRDAVGRFTEECQVVVNCVHGYSPSLYDASLVTGCHVVETGFCPPSMDSRHEHLCERGISWMVGGGWCPGLPELLERYVIDVARDRLGTEPELEGLVLSRYRWDGLGLADLAREYGTSASEARTRTVPDPAPASDAGGVRGRLRRLFKPNRPVVFTMVDLPEPLGRRLRALAPYEVPLKGHSPTIRMTFDLDLLPTYLKLLWFGNRRDGGWLVDHVLGPGLRNSVARKGAVGMVSFTARAGSKTLRVDMVETEHDGYWLTALVPATAARMLADGSLARSGFYHLPDAVEPVAFVRHLERFGLNLNEYTLSA